MASLFAIRQRKTGASVTVHPILTTILDTARRDHLSILTTEGGKPFTVPGFRNWFRDVRDEAGLPTCAAHGRRKAASRDTEAANRTQLAVRAFATLKKGATSVKPAVKG